MKPSDGISVFGKRFLAMNSQMPANLSDLLLALVRRFIELGGLSLLHQWSRDVSLRCCSFHLEANLRVVLFHDFKH